MVTTKLSTGDYYEKDLLYQQPNHEHIKNKPCKVYLLSYAEETV